MPSRTRGSREWSRRRCDRRGRRGSASGPASRSAASGSRRPVPWWASMACVGDDANQLLREHGAALADAVTAALPGWIVRAVTRFDPDLQPAAAEAGRAAAADLGPRLRALLDEDVDR